jgi:hypothetical protein
MNSSEYDVRQLIISRPDTKITGLFFTEDFVVSGYGTSFDRSQNTFDLCTDFAKYGNDAVWN